MRAFDYRAANSAQAAVAATGERPGASDKRGDGAAVFLAGGTMLDLMKLDVSQPTALVNVGDAARQLSEIEATDAGPHTRHSAYLKVRDRQSYAFASAQVRQHNAFKRPLGERTQVRALIQVVDMET